MDVMMDRRAATPLHLWIVGGLSLLWNLFGCTDYTMTRTHNAAWLAMNKVPAELLAKVDAAPIWGATGWALGVWCSLLGSVLLLVRSRHAPTAFLVSLVGAAVGFVWQFQAGLVPSPVLPAMIMLAVLLQWYYARRQLLRGVLR